MLSNSLSETPSVALASTPSGRPPDIMMATNDGDSQAITTTPIADSRTTPSSGGSVSSVPGKFHGEPALTISDSFKGRLCAPWQKTLVVRLLGLRISFNTLCSRLKSLWRPTGSIEIMDLDDTCYLVQLSNDQDYFKALTNGPWVIFDHYLAVQQWTPSFGIHDPLPKTMIVWVQLPALKVHFYHKEVLTSLGNLIGRTIKLDYHTLNRQRRKFARLAVEVDMSKPLTPRIWLDGSWQKVEYENLPTVCFECGKIGHSSTSCPTLRKEEAPTQVAVAGRDSLASAATIVAEPNPGFGPWILVTKKSRHNPRDQQKKGNLESESGKASAGQTNRNGKGGLKVKEGGDSLNITNIQKSVGLQRPVGQERKGNPSTKEGDSATVAGKDNKKGKEIAREGNCAGREFSEQARLKASLV
ncbi:unnamed protein product [Linum tenue]|uniref:CCHC-type domain-containing protein n=1 Tax=Linum tenue TaxID=586396 RepID=A0AAV0IPN9_9ROSI|nr:unnamed protein product [Linum tenue]